MLNLRINKVVLFKLFNFHSYRLLFISDNEGKVYLYNIETERKVFEYDISVINQNEHFIELKEDTKNKKLNIYFMPVNTFIFVFELEIFKHKQLSCIYVATNQINFKNKKDIKDIGHILKLINIGDILGNNIQSELIHLEFGFCISYKK